MVLPTISLPLDVNKDTADIMIHMLGQPHFCEKGEKMRQQLHLNGWIPFATEGGMATREMEKWYEHV